MNATLSPEERRLIDEAVAAGKVQRVPTGHSATFEPWIWSPQEGKLIPQNLLNVAPGKRKAASIAKQKKATGARMKASLAANRYVPQPCPIVAARRQQVLALYEEGFTGPEIMQRLGINESRLRNDIHALGVKLSTPPEERTGARAA